MLYVLLIYANNALGIHNIFRSRRAHKFCSTNLYKILSLHRLIIADVLIRIHSTHTYPRICIKFSFGFMTSSSRNPQIDSWIALILSGSMRS